jgi:hypothetical protein
MNEIQASMLRIADAWPTMSERDRRFILALLEALAAWVETPREVAR